MTVEFRGNNASLICSPDALLLLLIDVQPQFVDGMHGSAESVLARLEQLLIVCEWFKIPVVATLEEPTSRKGTLHPRLQTLLPADATTLTKHSYSVTGESHIVEALRDLGRHRVVVAGAETDVCVLQSVLGLIDSGHEILLLEDCLFSSEPNTEPAIARMRSAGVTPCTYKTLFYELRRTEARSAWTEEETRAIERGFISPETLPRS